MKAGEWIDRVKSERGWSSDYRVAKELQLTQSTISAYRRTPQRTLDETSALIVANALDIDPTIVLADQALERAKHDAARAAWVKIIEKLKGVAASILLTLGIAVTTIGPPDAHASERGTNSCTMRLLTHYTLRLLRNFRNQEKRKFWSWLLPWPALAV